MLNPTVNRIAFTIIMMCMILTGCGRATEAEPRKNVEMQAFKPEISLVYEAEEAKGTGKVVAVVNPKLKNFSGNSYVEGFEEDTDACIFQVEIPKEGFYDLNFVSAGMGGEKHNYVSVDKESIGTVYVEEAEFTNSVIERVYMTAGKHEITLSKYWGWISLDCLKITDSAPIDTSVYQITTPLCNPNASEEAKRLYSYLCDIYGKQFLSGQTCDAGPFGKEVQVIKKTTGKLPAIISMDFMDYTTSRAANGTEGHTTEYALAAWKNGHIVSFHWHWTVPEKYITGDWFSSFYKEHTNIDLNKIMNGQDEEGYGLLMQDMDVIAQQLTILRDNGVPVLFRPLHEASGGWFWWGAADAESYKKLYITMYEKFTKEYGLNNLIWVWNGQDARWYPGDEYVDIIGEDVYPGERVYTSQISKYLNAATNYSEEPKPVYMTENGCIFDPDLAIRDGAMWGMWSTWQGEFVAKGTAIHTLSEQYTEESMLIKAYEHEAVVTLDELPDLKSYPIREEWKDD